MASDTTSKPQIEDLRRLIQDRKTKQGKGRVSREIDLCLDADLAVEHDQAAAAVTAAQERIDVWRREQTKDLDPETGRPRGDRRMTTKTDGAPPPDLQAAFEGAEGAERAARQAKEAFTVKVKLTSVSSREWDELVTANPPRDGNDSDKTAGANWPAFLLDLFVACFTRAQYNGEPFDVEPSDLFEGLSPGENAMVEAALMAICKRQVSVSFSEAASSQSPLSGGKSRRR